MSDVRDRLKTRTLRLAGRVAAGLTPATEAVAALTGQWRAPILVYHQVAESGRAYPFRVTPVMFEAQMRWLADNRYHVVSLGTFLADQQCGRLTARSVVLTFDDGHRGVLLHACPVLKRYGFPATLFVTTGAVGRPEFPWLRRWLPDADPEEYRPVTWEELRAIHGPLVGLGSHSVSHPHLAKLPTHDIEREVLESRRHLEVETGADVRFFAYPGGIARYGDHSAATRRALAAAGYAAGLVSEIGRNGVSSDPYRLRRLSIEADDSLGTFHAKVVGAWGFVRGLQWAAQRALRDPSDY